MNLYTHVAWAAAVLIALGAGVLYERHEGAQSCVRRDVEAATKQELISAVDAAAAAAEVQKEGADHATAVAMPVVAPVVRVCPAAKPSGTGRVLQATTASARSDVPTAVPDPARPAPEGRDIGEPIEKIGQAADAQIAGLEAYITNVCLKR